jgi:hypothetical protein
MTKEQLLGPVTKLMKKSAMGGFKYRAFLTKSFFDELERLRL